MTKANGTAPRVGRPATLVDRTELRIGVPRALRRRLRANAFSDAQRAEYARILRRSIQDVMHV